MVTILYEDKDILVVQKPAGLESQSSRGFEPDMVSEIRRYLHNPQDIHSKMGTKPANQPPYVGVIHRLDKPVSGIMVYARNQESAGALSAAMRAGKMKKMYLAVVCGKPVDEAGTYVDYLQQDRKNNRSEIVDKSAGDSRKAALNYKVREVIHRPDEDGETYSLIDIELLTGRHHQIRVQFAGHGTPLYGDGRYGGNISTMSTLGDINGRTSRRESRPQLALCAYCLSFPHPVAGRGMEFRMMPSGGAFDWFAWHPGN